MILVSAIPSSSVSHKISQTPAPSISKFKLGKLSFPVIILTSGVPSPSKSKFKSGQPSPSVSQFIVHTAPSLDVSLTNDDILDEIEREIQNYLDSTEEEWQEVVENGNVPESVEWYCGMIDTEYFLNECWL